MLEPQGIVDADGQGRYLDALSLRSDATMDDIRGAQVALVHRFRSRLDVVAAVNHAAECAAEERCTRVNPIRVKRIVLESSLPQWDVPASDVLEYLTGEVDLDELVSDTVVCLRRSGETGDLEQMTIDRVLKRLQSEDGRARMCEWYCRQSGSRLNLAYSKVGSIAGTEQLEARALRRELLVCRMKVQHGLSLRPDDAQAQSLYDKISACLKEVERAASEPSSVAERIASLRRSVRGQVQAGRHEEAVAGLRAIADLCDDAESYFDLGTVLKKLQRFDEALPCFERVVVLRGCKEDIASLEECRILRAGENGRSAYRNGRAVLERGDVPAAVGLFRQAAYYDSQGEYYHWLGRALAQLGRLDDALTFFEQAARLRGDQTDEEWLGHARAQVLRQVQGAASAEVCHGDSNTGWQATDAKSDVTSAVSALTRQRTRLMQVAGVVLAALSSTLAGAFLLLALVTGEAVGIRLLVALLLLVTSGSLVLGVVRSHRQTTGQYRG